MKDTTACPFPAFAETLVGAPGIVGVVMLLEGGDAAPVPSALVDLAVNVYAVPRARPVISTICDVPTVAVIPPGFEVTV